MCAKNYTDNSCIKDALHFMQFEHTPSMKELSAKYKKLALQYHPDKNLDKDAETEEFQELNRCFKEIGDFIMHNVSNNVSNDEEESFKAMFKFQLI